jgi:hypothetical protein
MHDDDLPEKDSGIEKKDAHNGTSPSNMEQLSLL